MSPRWAQSAPPPGEMGLKALGGGPKFQKVGQICLFLTQVRDRAKNFGWRVQVSKRQSDLSVSFPSSSWSATDLQRYSVQPVKYNMSILSV